MPAEWDSEYERIVGEFLLGARDADELIPESAFTLDEVGRPGEPFFDPEEWQLSPAGVWTRPARVEAEQQPLDYGAMIEGWGMLGNGPYGDGGDALSWRARERVAFSIADPRAQVALTPAALLGAFEPDLAQDLVMVVDDPAERWASSWREFGLQLVDIVKHEIAVARGRPASSPGARWITAQEFVDRNARE